MNNLIRMMTAHATRTRKVGSVTVTGAGNYSGTPSVVFTGGGGSGAAATASMTANPYPGPIYSIAGSQSAGAYTLDSAAPSVSFSGGAGSGATATANFGSGFLQWLSSTARTTVQSGTITFSGGGGSGASILYSGGAARIAYIPNSIGVASGGSGYTIAPTVSWTPYGDGGTEVTYPSATANISGGAVVSITINSGGERIVHPNNDMTYGLPTPTLTGGNGSGASLNFPNWAITTVYDYWVMSGLGGTPQITPGSGYTSVPTASVPGLVTGSVTAIMGRKVESITVNNGGSYYNSPSISISGGTSVAGFSIGHFWYVSSAGFGSYNTVTSISVTNSGTGYSSTPTVSFSGGGEAAAATAVANMVSE